MKLKWQWFVGGRAMFWVSIILFILLIIGFVFTYIIDVLAIIQMEKQDINTDLIKESSEKYVNSYKIHIDKKIKYGFVTYTDSNILGTFHEWNNVYYINISVKMKNKPNFEEVVIHETRHMIVEYLKDKHVIDLSKYSEEIAKGNNYYYNNLFYSGIYLLQEND